MFALTRRKSPVAIASPSQLEVTFVFERDRG